MRTITKTLLVGAGVAFAGWVGWGVYSTRNTESVPYERLRALDGAELRRYPETIAVETTAPDGRVAFQRLFGYISGANRAEESISMTAPVETETGESISMTAPVRTETAGDDAGTVRMAFYLPSEYGPETAPEPTESDVALVTEPRRAVAVDRFSWYAPNWRVERRARKLRSTLEAEGIEPIGDPSLLRYNDPWTPPFMRRNELAVEVAGAD